MLCFYIFAAHKEFFDETFVMSVDASVNIMYLLSYYLLLKYQKKIKLSNFQYNLFSDLSIRTFIQEQIR